MIHHTLPSVPKHPATWPDSRSQSLWTTSVDVHSIKHMMCAAIYILKHYQETSFFKQTLNTSNGFLTWRLPLCCYILIEINLPNFIDPLEQKPRLAFEAQCNYLVLKTLLLSVKKTTLISFINTFVPLGIINTITASLWLDYPGTFLPNIFCVCLSCHHISKHLSLSA